MFDKKRAEILLHLQHSKTKKSKQEDYYEEFISKVQELSHSPHKRDGIIEAYIEECRQQHKISILGSKFQSQMSEEREKIA